MADEEKDYRHIVRVMNTDIDGSKQVVQAVQKIKGVGFMFANAVCNITQISHSKKAGTLTMQEVERLNNVFSSPAKNGIPSWMFNRRRDVDTGEDKHLLTTELKFTKENDIKMMKKIKSYRGIRHSFGLPVRGQRTKSNFRRNKGKGSLGVKRKSAAQPRKDTKK
jgi:small subunit ribosomal protein S13